ncbi:MAG: hypothetical protein J5905_01080 [Prevotella sp.]|nr:hypothetical protein [Prevotella sp.]
MEYSQGEYIEFYDKIRKRLRDIILEETGVYEFYIEHTPEMPSCCVIVEPRRPLRTGAMKYSNHDLGRAAFIAEPVKPTLSLSEELYGEFIDKKYKEAYIFYREFGNDNYSSKIRSLVETIAKDIYETFRKNK